MELKEWTKIYIYNRYYICEVKKIDEFKSFGAKSALSENVKNGENL